MSGDQDGARCILGGTAMGRYCCGTHVFGQHQLGWVGREANWMGAVLSLLPAESNANDKTELLYSALWLSKCFQRQ